MKLSAPKKVTFYIALILIVLGLIAKLGAVAALTGLAFWFVFAGAVVLVLSVLLSGL